MGKGLVAVVAVTLTVSAACGRDGVAAPDPTVPTAVTTTTAAVTAPADPFAVPPAIDAAYVDRVLVELNRVYGDVGRDVLSSGGLDRPKLDLLRAIYNDPLFELQVEQFATIPRDDPAIYKQPIGDRTMVTEEVITARQDCVFVRVLLDVSAVAAEPPPRQPMYITLRPTQPGADPARVNATGWSMSGESDLREDQCAA